MPIAYYQSETKGDCAKNFGVVIIDEKVAQKACSNL